MTETRQSEIIKEFKARYHEMGNRISFLESKLEDCKPLLLEIASSDESNFVSDADKLIRNWPSEALFALFNQDSLIERLRKITPRPPNAITWEQGVEIINLVQRAVWEETPL